MKARLTVMAAAAVLLAQLPAAATSFAILLSPGLQGESTDPAFPAGIDVVSLSVKGQLFAGSAGQFTLHKRIDKSSPLLARHCASGKHIAKAQLVLREAVPGGSLVYCVITMNDVLVSSWQCAAEQPATPPLESFQLRFSRLFYQYYAADTSIPNAYISLDQTGPDSDADGLSDPYEQYYGLDPAVPNGTADTDGDGLSDRNEARLGFNPVAGDSFFACGVGPSPAVPDTIDLSWSSVPGRSYHVQWSPDLSLAFQTLATVTADSTETVHSRVRQGRQGFFRVVPVIP